MTTTGSATQARDNAGAVGRWWQRRGPVVVALTAGAALWEIAGRYLLDPIYFAPFSATVRGLQEMVVQGELARALQESLQLFVVGMLLGTLAGLLVGLLIGRITVLATALEDYVTLLYVTPPIALVPFVLSILGFGFWPKVLIVVWFVFFPVCITTIEGVRTTSVRLLEVARSFGSSELGIWKDVVIPSTVPYAMSGIRQGIALGLVGVIAAEFLLDSSGVGELLNSFSRLYRMDKLFASVLVMVALGLASMAIGRRLENRFAAWRR